MSVAESYDVIVVGGGYTGLSAAYELTRAGKKVLVVEAEKETGGLAGTFEFAPGIKLERFYHHWFTSDVDALNMAEEMGLGPKLKKLQSRTALYYANSIFRLSSPLELLKFTAVPLIDRIRTGLMALYARRIQDWKPLEDITACDWIRRVGGLKAFKVMWEPLLRGKFGPEAENVSAVWFWNKLKLRGSSRGEKNKEELVYIEGGFGAFTTRLEDEIRKNGGEIRTGFPVAKIIVEDGQVWGIVSASGETLKASTVLATVPLPVFLGVTENLPQDFVSRASQIRFLGNSCLVLKLNRSLSSTYWLNVADPAFPFVGIIEHTNFDRPENYGGAHIAYLSKYLPVTDPLFSKPDPEYYSYCIPFLKKIFPDFSEDWVKGYSVWRAKYSQPVITKRYSKLIPANRTPVEGLWLATMAQVYPEDRGTSYAIREGRRIGREIATALAVT